MRIFFNAHRGYRKCAQNSQKTWTIQLPTVTDMLNHISIYIYIHYTYVLVYGVSSKAYVQYLHSYILTMAYCVPYLQCVSRKCYPPISQLMVRTYMNTGLCALAAMRTRDLGSTCAFKREITVCAHSKIPVRTYVRYATAGISWFEPAANKKQYQ